MRFEFGFECQPWNYLTSVEEPQRHSRYWFYPAEISFGVGVHPRGLRTQGRVGFLLLKIWDLSCNSWGNQDGRKTLCNFKGGRGWLAATRKRVLELFMKNKATTRRDGGGGQRNCCFGPLILEIRSWFRSEDLWLGWDQLLKQIVFFFSKWATQKCDPHSLCFLFIPYGLSSSCLTSDVCRAQCKCKYLFWTCLSVSYMLDHSDAICMLL